MSVHAPSTPEREPPPKGTLFCPDCGHESPARGDWIVRGAETESESTVAGAVLHCPVCEATVATRGRSELPQVA